MTLTAEQLNEIKLLAGLFFSVEDIITAIEISINDEEKFTEIILNQRDHPAFKAYHTGRLESEIELRKSIKQAALNGSNPAQNVMIDFYKKTKP